MNAVVRPLHRFCALCSLSFFLSAGLAPGADGQSHDSDATRERLQKLETELEERAAHQRRLAKRAQAAGNEAEAASRQLAALAADAQATEEQVQSLRRNIESLGALLREQETQFDKRRDQMVQVLAALQRLSRRPPEFALLRPGKAQETIKSAILLRETVPQLEEQARQIRAQLERILSLREEQEAERRRQVDALKKLDQQRQTLKRVHDERSREKARFLSEAQSEAEAVKQLAAKAEDLKALLEALQAERARRIAAAQEAAKRVQNASPHGGETAIPESAPLTTARGELPLPARGTLVKAFGEEKGTVREKGITIRTLAGAQVVAPYDGRVAFAGPFRGYGSLLIIAHSGGYHTLLAGMDRLYASVGQWVLAGEPVGAMSEEDISALEAASLDEAGPKLYIELRKGGDPVDPLPWLAAGLGKVS